MIYNVEFLLKMKWNTENKAYYGVVGADDISTVEKKIKNAYPSAEYIRITKCSENSYINIILE